jgi:putative glutamine amidotransferase
LEDVLRESCCAAGCSISPRFNVRIRGLTIGTAAPIIGITADLAGGRVQVGEHYARMVSAAGGTPMILPPVIERLPAMLAACDGVVMTGGDDPDMTRWGVATHPKAKPLDQRRQAFELALLEELDHRTHMPVLGVCFGMQLMGLHLGGTLEQHLPDVLPTAAMHWDHGTHEVAGDLGGGVVHSHHRQALVDAGPRLRVVARAPDGVIEAVRREDRPAMYLGVQWHPERTSDQRLGLGLFVELVNAAAGRGASPSG